MSTENPKVIALGDDSDAWMVTNTTDAHSADEAIRQFIERTTGETIEALHDADDLVEFQFNQNHWWKWERDQETFRTFLAVADRYFDALAFRGFLVTL